MLDFLFKINLPFSFAFTISLPSKQAKKLSSSSKLNSCSPPESPTNAMLKGFNAFKVLSFFKGCKDTTNVEK